MSKRVAFTAVLAASVMVMVTAGCSQSGSDEGGGGSDKPDELVIAGWGGTFSDAMYKSVFDPYTEATGIEIIDDSPTDVAKLKSMVDADNVSWDIIMSNPVETNSYCDDLYEPVDMSKINADEFVEGTVTKCGIPFDYYSTAMVYDTKKFGDNPPTSINDFFDTEKYPGKRLFPEDALEFGLEFALIADGVAADQLYPLDVDRALAKLDTIKDDLIFWKLGDEQVQGMESEAGSMGLVWTGRGQQVAENGGSFDVVWGAHMIGTTQLAVPKGSKSFDASMDLIKYATSPEPQARFNELMAYSAANLNAEPKLSDVQQHWDPLSENRAPEDALFSADYDYWSEHLVEVRTAVSNWEIG